MALSVNNEMRTKSFMNGDICKSIGNNFYGFVTGHDEVMRRSGGLGLLVFADKFEALVVPT